MATQGSGSGSGSGSGLAAGSDDIIHLFSRFDHNDTRLILTVSGNNTFRLNVMITSDSGVSKAVGKQVASAVVLVDSGTAGYVNSAELDIPCRGEMQIEIRSVGGTLAYYYDKRFYYAGTG